MSLLAACSIQCYLLVNLRETQSLLTDTWVGLPTQKLWQPPHSIHHAVKKYMVRASQRFARLQVQGKSSYRSLGKSCVAALHFWDATIMCIISSALKTIVFAPASSLFFSPRWQLFDVTYFPSFSPSCFFFQTFLLLIVKVLWPVPLQTMWPASCFKKCR